MPNSKNECPNFVAGKWIKGSGQQVAITSPYTGKPIGEIHYSTSQDLQTAVLAAKKASIGWGKAPAKERAQVLFRFRTILQRELDSISELISSESGKTHAEAKAGLLKGIEVLEYALSLQNSDNGGRTQVSRGVFCEYRREPLGVVAGITPFNFPAMVPMWMIPIALGVGNSFVWKPSDKTPLTSKRIAEALKEAQLPDGVFTVLHGGVETVEALIDHPDVAAVGFVGSSPVAKKVYQRATHLGKRALALGGAKNPVILMPDADPAIASRGITDSFTGCAGQRCMAASVLLAVGDVDSLLEKIVQTARGIRLGQDMGAIISRASLDKLNAAIERALKDGAKLLLDGRNPKPPAGFEGGYWLGPTILDQVKPGTEAACDELFGPLLSIVRCKNLTEALEVDRTNGFGNALSVFTQNGAVAERVAAEGTAGMIGVNIGVPVPREPFSFGGTKTSKYGAQDMTGSGGVEFWSQLKKVTVKWAEATDSTWMS